VKAIVNSTSQHNELTKIKCRLSDGTVKFCYSWELFKYWSFSLYYFIL